MLFDLSNELLFEILLNLTPSDIICSVRKVSRRLRDVSKDKHLWLRIKYHCDYLLPAISDSVSSGSVPSDTIPRGTISTIELEKCLLRGQQVKDIWTGRRPAVPRHAWTLHTSAIMEQQFSGLVGPYLVFHACSFQASGFFRPSIYSWFKLRLDPHAIGSKEGVLISPLSWDGPDHVFDLAKFMGDMDEDSEPKLRRFYQRNHVVRDEISTFYILFSQSERFQDNQGAEEFYLGLVSVAVSSSGTLIPRLEMSYHVKDPDFCESISANRSYNALALLGPVPDCDYVLARLSGDPKPICLINISTSKNVLGPVHDEFPGHPRLFGIHLTPSFLIQVKRNWVQLKLYSLPTDEELGRSDGPLHATNTYQISLQTPTILPDYPQLGSLPFSFHKLAVVSLSSTSMFIILGGSRNSHSLRVYQVQLTPGLREIEFAVEDFTHEINFGAGPNNFIPIPQLNQSRRIAATNTRKLVGSMVNPTFGTPVHYPVWISLEREAGEGNRVIWLPRLGPVTSIHHDLGAPTTTYLHRALQGHVDPFYGRAIFSVSPHGMSACIAVVSYIGF